MRCHPVRAITRSAAVLVLLLAAVSCAEEAEEAKVGTLSPVRLDAEKLAGRGLESFEPFPKEIVVSGRSEHSFHTFFSGEEVVVEVYQAEPAKLKIDEPWPYDEFIHLLSGELVLTDSTGKVTRYVAGESLVVPKGFLGTWEMVGKFRELVVIEKKAYVRAEGGE
jgi:uncharacterized cupin superfamily protein